MRERWTRTTPVLQLSQAEAAGLIRPAVGEAGIIAMAPLGGGHSNTNIRVTLNAAPHDVVLRLYQRDALAAAKEAAISRLVADSVPAPRYLHVGARPSNGQSYAVVEWVDGVPLSLAAKYAHEDDLKAMGNSIGSVLAAIHAFTFEQAGLLDGDLKVTPFPGGSSLSAYLETCFGGIAGERLGRDLAGKVVAFAKANEHRQEVWNRQARLTHFDFGASNILMRREGTPKVVAIVDWEFAASASPAADFGNLLRPPLGASAGFVRGVESGYRDSGGTLPQDWLELTALADMGAWAEFLTRTDASKEVIEDARAILSAKVL